MTRQVEFSELARLDLHGIHDYISNELDSPETARRIIERLTSSAANLGRFPHLGRSLDEMIERRTDYRFLACHGYLLFYRILDDHVEIERVLNGRMNYLATLGFSSDAPSE